MDEDPRFRAYRRLSVGGAQYLLGSLDLGFRRFAPDIVHIEYDPWSIIYLQALACRNVFAPRSRIVCTVKNNTYRSYPGPLGSAKDDLARSGVRSVDRFLAASRMVVGLYVERFGVPPERMTVLTHLAVDTNLFAPHRGPATAAADRERVIGYVGRLDPDKGVRELIEAVRICRERTGERLVVELLGNGSLRDDLARTSADTPWLRLVDPVPHGEVPRFLAGVDLFVLPARVSPEHEEHDAHALLEAMAAGLPCIGTRSGIIPEILGDGSGVLAEPNSADALAGALAALLAQPGRMIELGRRAREAALRSFSLDAVAAAKTDLYAEVLRSDGVTRS